MTETRKEHRLQIELVVRYREPTMLEPREAAAQDLALGGMFVMTPRPSPRGALLSFECAASGDRGSFSGTGRVIWQRNKSDPRGPAGMGVRFIRLEPGSRETVIRLIDQLNAESGEKSISSRPPPRASVKPVEVARPMNISNAPLHAPLDLGDTTPGIGGEAYARGLHTPTLHNVPSSLAPTPLPRSESSVLRERLDRTRRGVPPAANEARDPADAPTGPVSANPVRNPSRTLVGVGSDRPQRDPRSVRPPSPGPVDDLRPLVPAPVKQLSDPPRAQRYSQRPTARGAGQTLLEAPTSMRAPKALASQNEVLPADNSPSPRVHQETARRPLAEVVAEPVEQLPKASLGSGQDPLDRPSHELSRRGSKWLAWTIVGGGILVTFILARSLGGGAVGLPKGTTEQGAQSANASANVPTEPQSPAAEATTATPSKAAAYALDVETQPSGARVSAEGRFIMAPGRLELGALKGSTTVTAELDGYHDTTLQIVSTEFALHDGVYLRKLLIALPAQAASSAAVPERPLPPASPKAEKKAPAPGAEPVTPPKAPRPEATAPVPAELASLVSPPPGDTSAAPAAAPNAESPLDRALACLTQGDNACVIRELEDKAKTPREFEMLIETYRAIGSAARAEQKMRTYIERFPNGKRVAEYQRHLSPETL